MSDLIDRQEAIETYKNLCLPIYPLEELQSKKPRERWISVQDRLPKMRTLVLCSCQAGIFEVLKYTKDGWYHDAMHCYMLGFVRAWMPLPKNYKESEDK